LDIERKVFELLVVWVVVIMRDFYQPEWDVGNGNDHGLSNIRSALFAQEEEDLLAGWRSRTPKKIGYKVQLSPGWATDS
jgi:hypothetical protein